MQQLREIAANAAAGAETDKFALNGHRRGTH
jgi:hypothetical protein